LDLLLEIHNAILFIGIFLNDLSLKILKNYFLLFHF